MLSKFIQTETGAVTVDWVVLTAGLVGLGLASMAVVSSGVQTQAEATAAQLDSTFICTTLTTCSDRDLWSLALGHNAATNHDGTQRELADEIAGFAELSDYDLARRVYDPAGDSALYVGLSDVLNAYDGSPEAQDAVAQAFGLADGAALSAALPANGMNTIEDVVEVYGASAEFYDHYISYAQAEADQRGLTAADAVAPD